MENLIGMPVEFVLKKLVTKGKKIIIKDNNSQLKFYDRECVVKITETEKEIEVLTSKFLHNIKEKHNEQWS